MPEITLNPKTTALLLQDLQNAVIKDPNCVAIPMGVQQLIANCQKLRNKARQVGMPVIYVQVNRRKDLKDAPRPLLGAAATTTSGPLTEGAESAKIVSELAPQPSDVVVTKHTTGPFHTTDIEVYLRRMGINTLILTGYSTTGVVEASLRDARDQDYTCVVARDCCASRTAQEQDTCMDIIFPRLAWVATSDEIIKAIHG